MSNPLTNISQLIGITNRDRQVREQQELQQLNMLNNANQFQAGLDETRRINDSTIDRNNALNENTRVDTATRQALLNSGGRANFASIHADNLLTQTDDGVFSRVPLRNVLENDPIQFNAMANDLAGLAKGKKLLRAFGIKMDADKEMLNISLNEAGEAIVNYVDEETGKNEQKILSTAQLETLGGYAGNILEESNKGAETFNAQMGIAQLGEQEAELRRQQMSRPQPQQPEQTPTSQEIAQNPAANPTAEKPYEPPAIYSMENTYGTRVKELTEARQLLAKAQDASSGYEVAEYTSRAKPIIDRFEKKTASVKRGMQAIADGTELSERAMKKYNENVTEYKQEYGISSFNEMEQKMLQEADAKTKAVLSNTKPKQVLAAELANPSKAVTREVQRIQANPRLLTDLLRPNTPLTQRMKVSAAAQLAGQWTADEGLNYARFGTTDINSEQGFQQYAATVFKTVDPVERQKAMLEIQKAQNEVTEGQLDNVNTMAAMIAPALNPGLAAAEGEELKVATARIANDITYFEGMMLNLAGDTPESREWIGNTLRPGEMTEAMKIGSITNEQNQEWHDGFKVNGGRLLGGYALMLSGHSRHSSKEKWYSWNDSEASQEMVTVARMAKESGLGLDQITAAYVMNRKTNRIPINMSLEAFTEKAITTLQNN